MTVIDKMLDRNEEIIWRGKPKLLPFMFGSLVVSLFGLVFLAIPLLGFLATGDLIILVFPHFWIGLLIFLGVPLYSYFVHKYIEYAITSKRIVIQKGLIGRDFDTIDYEKIQDISVDVGLIDRIFGTGKIISSSAGRLHYRRSGPVQVPGNIFVAVENPYEVFKLLKRVAMDVKADIHYPTKYRPRDNVGYNTRYRPKK